MAVVPARRSWVNANFKETQLTDAWIGQSVSQYQRSLGENVVFRGSDDRDQYGNRRAFSYYLHKMRRGTGSKIVQRVQLISLDQKNSWNTRFALVYRGCNY